jgi:hypothetical protein
VEYIADGLTGDFNRDQSVSAADYVAWRKTDGTLTGYDLWQTRFGEAGGGGSITSSAIPEPASSALLIFVVVGCYLRRGVAM